MDVEQFTIRECLYRILGLAYYRQPDETSVRVFASMDLFGPFSIWTGDERIREGLELIATFLVHADRGKIDEELAELQCDYVRLFVGPGMPLAPPWESVYRTEERVLFGPQTLEVRAAYEAFGLVTEHRNKEPDDHIGLELEFMAVLSRSCRDCLLGGDREGGERIRRAQLNFLDVHLLQWAPRFCRNVYANAETKLYAGIASVTEGLLCWDRVFLDTLHMEDRGNGPAERLV